MAELTPKQVAAMREFAIHDPVKREDDVRAWVVELCDTVDALRKRLNNLRHEQNRWVESDQAAMRREKKALQDVADLREQLRLADGTIDRLIERNEREIRRVTAALREVRHCAAPYPDGAGRELNEEAFAEIQQIADRALAEEESND